MLARLRWTYGFDSNRYRCLRGRRCCCSCSCLMACKGHRHWTSFSLLLLSWMTRLMSKMNPLRLFLMTWTSNRWLEMSASGTTSGTRRTSGSRWTCLHHHGGRHHRHRRLRSQRARILMRRTLHAFASHDCILTFCCLLYLDLAGARRPPGDAAYLRLPMKSLSMSAVCFPASWDATCARIPRTIPVGLMISRSSSPLVASHAPSSQSRPPDYLLLVPVHFAMSDSLSARSHQILSGSCWWLSHLMRVLAVTYLGAIHKLGPLGRAPRRPLKSI